MKEWSICFARIAEGNIPPMRFTAPSADGNFPDWNGWEKQNNLVVLCMMAGNKSRQMQNRVWNRWRPFWSLIPGAH